MQPICFSYKIRVVIVSLRFGHTVWKLLNMLQGLIQRTCLAVANTAQTLLVREKHVFNRALLKPKVRCHFPKPMEVKRINVHGWDTRMSTPEGRRVLMRRILKGRHDLSH